MKFRSVGIFTLGLFSILIAAAASFITSCGSSNPASPAPVTVIIGVTATPAPPTATWIVQATQTAVQTATAAVSQTLTLTVVQTSTATSTPTRTLTSTTNTATPTATNTPTHSATSTNTGTPTATITGALTSTSTITPTATETPTNTSTITPPPTMTATATPTATSTVYASTLSWNFDGSSSVPAGWASGNGSTVPLAVPALSISTAEAYSGSNSAWIQIPFGAAGQAANIQYDFGDPSDLDENTNLTGETISLYYYVDANPSNEGNGQLFVQEGGPSFNWQGLAFSALTIGAWTQVSIPANQGGVDPSNIWQFGIQLYAGNTSTSWSTVNLYIDNVIVQ